MAPYTEGYVILNQFYGLRVWSIKVSCNDVMGVIVVEGGTYVKGEEVRKAVYLYQELALSASASA